MNSVLTDLLIKKNLEISEIIKEPDGGLVRSYVVLVTDSNNKKYIVKFLDSKDPNSKERFIREIKIIRKLRKNLPSKYRNWVVNIRWYSYNKNNSNPYYIYEYVNGELLGHFTEDFGIKWGFFNDKNFDKFIGFFKSLQKIDLQGLERQLSHWGPRYTQKELEHYFNNIPNLFGEELKRDLLGFYDNKKQNVFKKMVISHRDLYPENIIIKDKFKSKFTFLDFEYLSYVPIGYDAAFLYLLFWKEEYWRGKIFSYFYKMYKCDESSKRRIEFITSFRFCIILLGIRFMYQLKVCGDKDSDIYDRASNSFVYDIQNALKNTISKPSSIKYLVCKEDLQKIADRYELGKIVKYTIFYASKGNTVAKVSTSKNKTYIFRLYSRLRSNSLINRELSILNHLNESGIKTYKVLPASKNKLFDRVFMYGIHQRVAVLTYVKGKKITKEWATQNAALNAGKILNNIHDKDVVHGDYSKENVLFVKDYVSGVIDFEWGRQTKSNEAKLDDLAKAIALWLVDVRSKNINDSTFAYFFIKGYLDRKPTKMDLERIIDRVIDKIEEERNIFLRTGVMTGENRKYVGSRFDEAINSIKLILEDE